MKTEAELPEIQISDVQAGDVLLSMGNKWTSHVIREVAGGDYSHAAYFDGVSAIEADSTGVNRTTVAEQVCVQEYVDVYRYHSADGRVFSEPDWPATPVSNVAHHYLDRITEYPDNQIILVGILAWINRKVPDEYKESVRDALNDTWTHWDTIFTGGETKTVSCTEFIYRCFYEAEPESEYELKMSHTNTHFQTSNTLPMHESISILGSKESLEDPAINSDDGSDSTIDDEIRDLIRDLDEKFQKITSDKMDPAMNYFQIQAAGGNAKMLPELVSPYDLQRSTSLNRIGRLPQPPKVS